MTLPRGIRNRNPGNIRCASQFNWIGELKLPKSDKRYDAEFCVFEDVDYGLRALMKLLINYQQKHGLNTVRKAINRWAPPIENNTSAYVKAVAKHMDVDPDTELNFTDYTVLVPMTRAIVLHENGNPANQIGEDYKSKGYDQYWYTPATYQNAYELAAKGRLITHTMNQVIKPEVLTKPKPKPSCLERILNTIKGA